MDVLEGIPVSPGVAIGRIAVLDYSRAKAKRKPIAPGQVEHEIARFEKARTESIEELNRVFKAAQGQVGDDPAKIFLFHIGVLQDKRNLVQAVHDRIREQLIGADAAAAEVFQAWIDRFMGMKESSFTTKADDIRDLSDRVIGRLTGQRRQSVAQVAEGSLVIARDLTPSQTVALDRGKVLGFATDLGGRTSHTAIVAKALGIPAVVGCRWTTQAAAGAQSVIIDGDRGRVIFDPDQTTLDDYARYEEQRRNFHLSLDELAGLEARTSDGVLIELLGNIEFPDEAADVILAGGRGVGLYRTEFLFLTSDTEPSETDHFEAYKAALAGLGGKPLTIRTVDLGADKYTQERAETPERNPFLGNRSIRYCFKSPAMFKTQLRAILRASALGPVKMMFPLITSLGEFRQARLYVREVMEDLAEEGVAYDAGIAIGMMVEVPSAAIMADVFAREADFFSIGTNDLVQYTLAVDRTNEQVAPMFDPAHPAVIRLIREVVKAGRRQSRPVSVCGESAADPEYALLLMGLGLRTLSVTASTIPTLKRMIRAVSLAECERIAKKALVFDSPGQVSAFLRDQARKIVPEGLAGRSGGA